ncbi:GTPase [Brachyspira aalborgi]|uniref:G domain-containing protein n=1 Tax=Brachyspira aalborgi TaxID=29522 RepID=A0A5C8FVF0_9SPIR|nr:GTPase [Brachyspira aalborgi]TXJ53455.1 hypothetical protein EPJ76_12160 [Brachyspira aalborgi]
MTEEQKKKIEEIINSYEEKYNKDFEEALTNISNAPEILNVTINDVKEIKNYIPMLLFWYDKSDLKWNIVSPLHLEPTPQDKARAKFLELLAKTKDKTVENIIDLTIDLSEVFGNGITKEEAKKLLFNKKATKMYGIFSYLNIFTEATEEFIKIMKNYEKGYFEYKNYEEEICSIKNIGEAIANYFDGKENNNNENEEKNKNFNKENKINNVVENTAKEKIMTEEQKKKCEEIINSYKTKLGDIDIGLLMNPFSIIPLIHHQHRYDVKSMTISLAKVFNKDITEKEAEKIISDLREDYLKENPKDKKYKDFESMSWAIVDKLDDELILNLLILGKTGTGKSSLVNALVGEEVAKVGDAEPETEDIYPYSAEIDGKKIIIHDSWGMEVGKEDIWDDIINKKLKEKGIDKDIKDWFHSVTYCIQAGGNRIEDFDAKIITKFIKDKYNVIVALTKAEQMGKEDREKFTEKIKERIKKEIEKEDAKNDININDIIVVSVSASPKKLDYMTEAPKPYGLEEYKAAILISWREIFINRIPVHIVKKLKEDIENAKSNAPRKGKDKELSNKIQEYFSNILNANTQKYVRESIEKYYKITADILASSKNINLSNKKLDLNFYSEFDNDGTIEFLAEMFRDFGDLDFGWRIKLILLAPLAAIPMGILEFGIVRPLEFLLHIMEKGDKIEKFINDVSEEYTKKIGEEEFESEIRKIIINALNEIDKKIIKLN